MSRAEAARRAGRAFRQWAGAVGVVGGADGQKEQVHGECGRGAGWSLQGLSGHGKVLALRELGDWGEHRAGVRTFPSRRGGWPPLRVTR